LSRRFPLPWKIERIPRGDVAKDASGQSLAYAYAYAQETKAQAETAMVLTMDEARRIAANISKRPDFLKR
jgi:hypothetical protein